MNVLSTTGPRRNASRRKLFAILFWLLLITTLVVSWLVSLTLVGESAFMNAYTRVSIERYWLREFSNVRGVQGYAETLLATDVAVLHEETSKALIPPFYPFIILLPVAVLFITAASAVWKRTLTKWHALSLALSMLFVISCVCTIYFRIKD